MTQYREIIFVIIFFHFCGAFEENDSFCIRTDPIFLDDIERHENPIIGDPRCRILATTLTNKEKETLHKTICKDYGNTRKDEYYFFQLYNGNLKDRGNHHEICEGKRNIYLAWIPYNMVQSHYATELNPKERSSYIAKATDIEREKTELCYFRGSDLATNITENLFTCIVMVFEDNFYGLDANINVLVEVLPLMYELDNVTYLPWANVTTSYKTRLGKATLTNQSPAYKQVYGSVSYAYIEKVKLNTTSVYGKKFDHLPILFNHKGTTLELDDKGTGGVNVKERVYFGRHMDPKSNVNVEVIGQWAEYQQQFTADIYEYFGCGKKRFCQEINRGEVSFVRIQSTETIYESPESSHLARVTIYKSIDKHKFDRLTTIGNGTSDGEDMSVDSTTEYDLDWEAEEFDIQLGDEHSHHNFYPWYVIGGLILGALLLAVIIGIVRTCSKEYTHKYRVTGNC